MSGKVEVTLEINNSQILEDISTEYEKMLEKLNGLVRSKSGSRGNRNIHTFAKRRYVI